MYVCVCGSFIALKNGSKNAHTYIDNQKKEKLSETQKKERYSFNACSLLLLLLALPSQEWWWSSFFSSRMGIEKEKIAEEEMFMPSTFYTSVHARSFASYNSTIKRTTKKKGKESKREGEREKNSIIIAWRECHPIYIACMYELWSDILYTPSMVLLYILLSFFCQCGMHQRNKIWEINDDFSMQAESNARLFHQLQVRDKMRLTYDACKNF